MELSRAESATHAQEPPEGPQGAVDTAHAILELICPSKSPSDSPTHSSELVADEESRRELLQEDLQSLILMDANTDFCLPPAELPLYVSDILRYRMPSSRRPSNKLSISTWSITSHGFAWLWPSCWGVLAKWDLHWVTQEFTPQIVDSVVANLSRSRISRKQDPFHALQMDDVSGWKALESSLCALKYIIKGSGEAFLEVKVNDNGDEEFVT
ncbi:uncharacterized protein KRP23_3022 [Phytophthora ramorum]|uniref:uncharacterized protein n=1 Tax=Phytophthora ramorum TaxID=164328 RepID=UPI0030B25F8D|nr:hypothetical protein KRP23_3022 [Phytophthora ramorum]